jgi:hypothetical protein
MLRLALLVTLRDQCLSKHFHGLPQFVETNSRTRVSQSYLHTYQFILDSSQFSIFLQFRNGRYFYIVKLLLRVLLNCKTILKKGL